MPYPSHEETGDSEQERHVLVASGEINLSDRRLANALLRRFGLEVKIFSEEEYVEQLAADSPIIITAADPERSESEQYSIFGITDPGQYLVKEHFRDYGRHAKGAIKTKMGTVFSYLLFGETLRQKTTYPRVTEKPVAPLDGIEIAPRESTAEQFEPSKLIVQRGESAAAATARMYAMRAGSIVDYATLITTDAAAPLNAYERAAVQLAGQLQSQFSEQ